VQVVTVSTAGGTGAVGGGRGGSVAVVANGYVVARTKAAVSAKIPGRLAMLNVSEVSRVEKGAIIPRLDNADSAAAVAQAEAEVGEAVAASVGGGRTRGAVVTVADRAPLEVDVDVNEAYIGRIHSDEPARITLYAYPDTAFRGTVRQIIPTADRQRATVQVKVSILDRDPRILTEMGAKVEFLGAVSSSSSPQSA